MFYLRRDVALPYTVQYIYQYIHVIVMLTVLADCKQKAYKMRCKASSGGGGDFANLPNFRKLSLVYGRALVERTTQDKNTIFVEYVQALPEFTGSNRNMFVPPPRAIAKT